MLFIKSCKSLVKGFMPRCFSVLFLILALLLGFLVYYQGQGLEPIDALYLTIVTISTVGYGDISPSDACVDDEGNDASSSAKCAGLRVFTVFYILIGCGYVFSQLANLFEGVLKAFSSLVKKAIDRFDTTDKAVDTTGDGMADTKVAGRSEGLSDSARDLTGDGKADFIEPPTAMVYWAQELMPAMFLLMALQLVSAGIFTVCIPGLDFGTALYHCFITATTVGYGDVAMSTPEARLFACLHIVVSVSWLAALVSDVDSLRGIRKSQLQRAELILSPPNREQIMGLDKDGKGVDRVEFVVGMMMILGVELCGQPLAWDDVRPFLLQFDMFDVSKTERLSTQDLEEYVAKMSKINEEQAAMRQNKQQRGGNTRALAVHPSPASSS